MTIRTLRQRLIIFFLAVIAVMACPVVMLGYHIISRQMMRRVDAEVYRALGAARFFYNLQLDRIGEALRLVGIDRRRDIEDLKTFLDLHYLVRCEDLSSVTSPIARAAISQRRPVVGTRIIPKTELVQIDPNLAEGRLLRIRPTPKARPTERSVLDAVMAKECAVPILDDGGSPIGVVYGGRVINLDYAFVDRIRTLVFGDEDYRGVPVGTVTVFQDDVRIATNVVDEYGDRAVGTRVSAEVYKAVVEEGKTWLDRAFVVTDWYKTAYEPIRDIEGKIIGILYVGILERPFKDMATRIALLFLLIVAGATVLAVVLALLLAATISRPLTEVVRASECLAAGDWDCRLSTDTPLKELNTLAEAFNAMAAGLKERDEDLRQTNQKLLAANKNYVDLIGFVAHELKGLLAPAVMNVYSIRDGYLGMINFKQQKAIESVARSLDYLSGVVQKFLNLGRIERGNLVVNRQSVLLRQDILGPAVDSMAALSGRKGLKITIDIDQDISVNVDPDLMRVAANNLVNNAVKYAKEAGKVAIRAAQSNGKVRVEIYNDSIPISPDQLGRLFKKFSRLDNEQTRKEKGTGLGLYITKQIIEAHGGRIWAEPRSDGNAFIFEIPRG
ncbi:MAG: cache domain-containing protein [Sedimentisphaerales bacterium]|nr:cache domain-containing protein [Sedimentisphaerales bacterium]